MTRFQMPLRLLVTGSRNWPHEHLVHIKLSEKLQEAGPRGLILVHGGCPDGVDNFAHRWFERERINHPRLREEVHHANWLRDRGAAGFKRNEKMVRLGAWGVLAFVAPCIKEDCKREGAHGSHGATHCLKVAKHYNLPIRAWKTKEWSLK